MEVRRDERGAALLEFTVVLPVLLAIGLGVFEFGNLIYNYHLIGTGVRDAARFVAGLPTIDENGNSLRTQNDEAAINIAMRGTADTSGELRVPWWSNTATVSVVYTDHSNVDGSGNQLYRGGDVITTVTVAAEVPYQALGFLGYLGLGNITLSSQHEERVFGVR